MDIRQVADSERASRFHHGFYNFAHYGRLYILEAHGSGNDRSVECVPVTNARHITPSSELSGDIQFHDIDHYNECIRRVNHGKAVEKINRFGRRRVELSTYANSACH